jgi:thiamine biosynthesis lipoprotein ApbE
MLVAMLIITSIVVIPILAGFIYIQIKYRLVWRLLSLALVLIGSCWACSNYTHFIVTTTWAESYMRGSRDFVTYIDEMTMQGRTNEVHQACQAYLDAVWTEHYTTDFDSMVARLSEKANEQPTNQIQFKLHSTPTP